MTSEKRAFVSFLPEGKGFRGVLSAEAVIGGQGDPESLLREAERVYQAAVGEMRSLTAEIEDRRSKHVLVPARTVWRLGDAIFGLKQQLGQLSLEANGLYDHLVRDLGVKRKWLEKVVILRRYIPAVEAIPESLNWGRCEKGTRRVAQSLLRTWTTRSDN